MIAWGWEMGRKWMGWRLMDDLPLYVSFLKRLGFGAGGKGVNGIVYVCRFSALNQGRWIIISLSNVLSLGWSSNVYISV